MSDQDQRTVSEHLRGIAEDLRHRGQTMVARDAACRIEVIAAQLAALQGTPPTGEAPVCHSCLKGWRGAEMCQDCNGTGVQGTPQQEQPLPKAAAEVLYSNLDRLYEGQGTPPASPEQEKEQDTQMDTKAESAPTPNDWLPSEALYAFMGWLTCRNERTVCSGSDDAAPAANRIAEFCKRHGLTEPREGWEKLIVSPESSNG